jgi:hypothetical protein
MDPIKSYTNISSIRSGNDGGTEIDRESGKGDKRINEGYQK